MATQVETLHELFLASNMAGTLNFLVDEWLRLDKNESTRQQILHLRSNGQIDELEKRMRKRIEFGTAGLRGRMEAGWSRMNDLIVIQASQGLCQYVIRNVPNALERGVVIGHDHRHNSERWAKLTAAAFLQENMKVYLHRGLVHTPMVPFTVGKVKAACGVMITASHNPKDDNGYKVYWENAVQIIGPHDKGISKSIKANLEPRTWSTEHLEESPLCLDKTDEMKQAYFDSLLGMSRNNPPNKDFSIKFINTSMHGVSDPFVTKAFELFGFPNSTCIPVKEQQLPDPDFPTVIFPNPEEKGALDIAIQTADRHTINYVLAQDPDSDRFAAAERSGIQWTMFTGDQLGILFANRVLEAHKDSGKPLAQLGMVASTVSSRMVKKIAELEGFKFVECLTGFKYIGNTALALVEQGFEVPFGYEEAIGYMFGSQIRDKDGVAATMAFAELVVSVTSKGMSVKQHLDELYNRYGYFKTNNSYFICENPETIDKIFARVRHFSSSSSNAGVVAYPTEIAGLRITRVIDLTTGYDSGNAPSYKPTLPLSSGHMIQFEAERDLDALKIVLTVRTSGTEPKIKYYLEGCGKYEEKAEVDALLEDVVKELGGLWFEADKNNLGRPEA